MIVLDSDTVLTQQNVSKILQHFASNELPKLHKLENYYLGKHDILNRYFDDASKPNNKMVINYPCLIADSYSSYLVGNPVSYSNNDRVTEILQYNDVADIDLETVTDANIFGYGINQMYLDEDSKIRFCRIKPTECILIYDNSLNENLMYAIRFYNTTSIVDLDGTSTEYFIELYDKEKVMYFKSNNMFSSLVYQGEQAHYFKDVPFVEFKNNDYRQSSFEQVIPLVDCLEKVNSDAVNTWEQFADCYMILKNITAEAEDVQQMKIDKVLVLPADADASYLTKEVNVDQINNLKNDIVENIHKVSCVPNMSDENFANNASGVAIRYKLLSFENATAKKERKLKKGLQRRIELIYNILAITDNLDSYMDVKITFTRNLPANVLEQAQIVNTLRGIVSSETLLALLPFVDNVKEEEKALQKEKDENMQLYSFSNTGNTTMNSGDNSAK